jgi:AmpD protein
MTYPELVRHSPHFDASPSHERLGVLFHHSVMSFDETIALMCGNGREVSYHCLISPEGSRCTLVADEHRAWHAGASTFLGRIRCNDFLLGLAFAGDTYTTPLTDAQLASAIEWLETRWHRYSWTTDRMTDHRQVAPGRKDDLNPTEWDRVRALIEKRFGKMPSA